MQNPAQDRKAKTLESLSICVLALDVTKGHLRWKVTELEKKAGISRSLIYRYLGPTKEEILRNALQTFTVAFYGFGPEGLKTPFPERVRRTREFLIVHPEAGLFYQKWRSKESWLADELAIVEKKFQKKLRNLYPSLNELEVTMVHAFLHGLVTAPFLSGSDTEKCAEALERMLLKN